MDMESAARVAVVLLPFLGGILLPRPVQANEGRGRVVVEAEGFRSARGDALYALFRTGTGFPREPLEAERRLLGTIAQDHSRVVFEDVEPGEFAISVLHDEDQDRELKKGMLGIPREGIGFSRDARGRMGPPKFKDAKLTLTEGQSVTVRIHMTYY